MSSKLTVSKLRDELQKRGLDITGLKPTLVSRLDEAIAGEEVAQAASKQGNNEKDIENGEKRKRSSDSSPDEEENKNAKRPKVEDVSGMTAKELKEALSKRGLSTAGKKDELIERLTEAVEAEAKDSEMLADSKPSPADEENENAGRPKGEDVSGMTARELKEALSKRGLPTAGKKDELVERLTEAVEVEAKDSEMLADSKSTPADEENEKAKRPKVEDVSGMTAKELKEALSKRGLSTAGKKDELIERLTEAVEAEAKDRKMLADSKSTPADEENENAGRPKGEDVSGMTARELKEALSKRGLPTAGKKDELVERLTEAVEAEAKDSEMVVDNKSAEEEDESVESIKVEDISNMNVKEIKEALSTRGLSTSGKKSELVERLTEAVESKNGAPSDKNAGKDDNKPAEEEDKSVESTKVEDISNMNVKEIKEALSTRGLSTSGKKSELIERLTEAVEAKNGAPSDKNAGKDDKGAKVVVVKKGRAVLDQYIDDKIKKSHHVYEGKLNDKMEVFDAMLNQTNVGENNNKFYVLQILEGDSGRSYYVFLRWGRVGVKGQQKLFGPWGDAQMAMDEFQVKFYEKTRNHWQSRHDFVAYPNKYTWIELDYEEDSDKKTTDQDDNQVKPESQKLVVAKPSKLERRVKEFVDLICNVNMMQQMMMEIGYDARKMPLGKLSKSTILKGYEVLKRLAAALDDKSVSAWRSVQQLSSEFYTVIPHDFGFKKMSQFIIDTPQKLKKKLEMVEALGEIEVATKLLVNDMAEDEDPSYTHYSRLNCELEPLDTACEEFELIKHYLEKTHGETHSYFKLELINVFKLQRDGESDRFKPFEKTPNRMLLWHGSRLSNWTGILSQGLRIAPPEAPVTGYMFGKGVYFADMVSKSANYCCTSASDPVGVLLLSEVALGDMNELFDADYHADNLPKGKLSTKGVGRTIPNPKEVKTLEDGVVVPLGSPVQSPQVELAGLMYNEYIVYDVSQIRMRYLLQVRFNYQAWGKY